MSNETLKRLVWVSWLIFFMIICWKEGYRPFEPEVGVLETGYAPLHPDDEM